MQTTPPTAPAQNSTTTRTFGGTPTDHMFVAQYAEEKWDNGSTVPFGNLTMSPFALCLHYGQTVFEGMKAYRQADGSVVLFRSADHFNRFNRSLERMAMPPIPREVWDKGLADIVELDHTAIPEEADGSLYIRPFAFATEERLGVKVSEEYHFMVVASPVRSYYANPLNVKIERHFTRAAKGGTGYAKCGGNYGGSLHPTRLARQEGFDQIVWTDARDHAYIEESGTMNVAVVRGSTLITPPTTDTVLDGMTRRSVIAVAPELGLTVEERPIAVQELVDWISAGERVEFFGCGTAAVIAPIGSISVDGTRLECYHGADATMFAIKQKLSDICRGLSPDTFGWLTAMNPR